MPTATRTSPSAEHEKLVQRREETYAAVQEVKRRHQAHDEETEGMRAVLTVRPDTYPEEFEGVDKRPKSGTEAAKMRDRIMVRLRGPNPYQADLDAAISKFHEADTALTTWRQRNLLARLAERQPDKDAAVEQIRASAVALLAGIQEYRALTLQDRDAINETPPLNGQDLRYDPRLEDWGKLAAEIRDADILTPGLNDAAVHRLARFAEELT